MKIQEANLIGQKQLDDMIKYYSENPVALKEFILYTGLQLKIKDKQISFYSSLFIFLCFINCIYLLIT